MMGNSKKKAHKIKKESELQFLCLIEEIADGTQLVRLTHGQRCSPSWLCHMLGHRPGSENQVTATWADWEGSCFVTQC